MELSGKNTLPWTRLYSIAAEEGLVACIPATDARGRMCQGFLFADEADARRFGHRLSQEPQLPPFFIYESARLVAIRFVASLYEKALYDGLRYTTLYDRPLPAASEPGPNP